ncbi:unnamed protein product [Urochloa decumbens]|uniref:RING-type E3 ubiquitin transferase n=1 Tax=Urochloa decumbens TaxID=240449 RepID=A0ABC8ZQM3_9POAL
MERGESSKRALVKSPTDEVKEEVLDRDEAATGEGALVNMESATARVELTVRIDVAKLHCPICMLPFKPPIFQCLSGHLACGVCHDQHPNKGRCLACGLAGAYVRCTMVEDIIESIRIQCPYDAYGCRSYVTYHATSDDHQRACPWAPCACAEPGCGFLGSPPMLRDHLRDAHAWPVVDKVCYGRAHNLRLPASQTRSRGACSTPRATAACSSSPRARTAAASATAPRCRVSGRLRRRGLGTTATCGRPVTLTRRLAGWG